MSKVTVWLPWVLGVIVCCLAILAWGHNYSWHFLPLNAYILFPLMGLLAFSLMWTHYVIGTLRELFTWPKAATQTYFSVTGWLVLALICLHPGLLIYQRFRDGYGLPPGSYESYVAPGLGWVTILGTASLLIFLAFELKRIYGQKSWWHFVQEAGDFAMLAIVYHSLRLGSELVTGWFRAVWWFYGLVLVIILIRSYYNKYGKYLFKGSRDKRVG